MNYNFRARPQRWRHAGRVLCTRACFNELHLNVLLGRAASAGARALRQMTGDNKRRSWGPGGRAVSGAATQRQVPWDACSSFSGLSGGPDAGGACWLFVLTLLSESRFLLQHPKPGVKATLSSALRPFPAGSASGSLGDSPFSAHAPRGPLGILRSPEYPYIFTCGGDKDVPQLLSMQPSNWRVIP